jgi:copper homeostasis protein
MRKLEVIALTLQDAINAEAGGADSLELVENLPLGGLTPPYELVRQIRDRVKIALRVIVRSHAESFVYSEADAVQMLKNVAAFKQIGADGIVFGALHPDNTINLDLTRQIAAASHPLELTFHRAIDLAVGVVGAVGAVGSTGEPDSALRSLRGMARRILTSGQTDNVWDGRDVLNRWIKNYGADFTIACGGGIKFDNLAEIVRATNGPEYHVGTAAQTNGIVDTEKVRQMVKIINQN